MTEHEPYGPGLRWLAERVGVPPTELFADPVLLLKALGTAVRDAIGLAAESVSPDPEVRRTALDRADMLASRLASKETPGERFGRTVAAALLQEADRLRSGARPAYADPKSDEPTGGSSGHDAADVCRRRCAH
jgi:hypothetical protein